MQFLLSTKAIEAAIRASETGPDRVLPDSKTRGSGRLLLRAHNGSGLWQFRYAPAPGEDDKLALGHYAKTAGKGGMTLAEARTKAAEWGAMLRNPETRNLRAYHARVQQAHRDAERVAREASEAAEREKAEAGRYTLGALLTIYCDHLKATGKASAGNVAGTIDKHLIRDRPALASRPAREIERKDVALLVRGVVEGGAKRSAGLLRSYLASAYRLAIAAEGDPLAPASMIPFAITRNPVEGVKTLAVGTRDRALSETELRFALARMAQSNRVAAHLLRACVMGGGQRPLQMSRAKVTDYDAAAGTLLLWDGKGTRKEPRPHLLPLGPETQAHIVAMVERARKLGTDYLFTDDGTMPIHIKSVSRYGRELRTELLKAGEITAPFQTKDLRRTAETLQAKYGFAKDLRAQLLSHGLSGIQSARYDRHDYLEEKRAALVRWETLLKALPEGGANVVALAARRAG